MRKFRKAFAEAWADESPMQKAVLIGGVLFMVALAVSDLVGL